MKWFINNDSVKFSGVQPTRSSSIAEGNAHVRRVGQLYVLDGWFRNPTAVSSSTTIFTVQSTYRPKTLVSGCCVLINTSGNVGFGAADVDADGKITQNITNSALQGAFVITWLRS